MTQHNYEQLIQRLHACNTELSILKYSHSNPPEVKTHSPAGSKPPLPLKWVSVELTYSTELANLIYHSGMPGANRLMSHNIKHIIMWLIAWQNLILIDPSAHTFMNDLDNVLTRFERALHNPNPNLKQRALNSDKKVTAAEGAILASAILGSQVSRKNIENWGRRGKLHKHITNNKTLYTLGDIIRIINTTSP